MRLRIRGPGGASAVTLAEDATVGDLKKAITEKTTLTRFDVKYSYPPKTLVLPADKELLSTISAKLDGEQLTISEASSPPRQPSSRTGSDETDSQISSSAGYKKDQSNDTTPQSSKETTTNFPKPIKLTRPPAKMDKELPELPMPERDQTLIVRVMPDDNSCMFRAVSYAVMPDMDIVLELRTICSDTIQADPETYTKAILDGREPAEYCKWLLDSDSWGGAIELGILANHFDIEICAVDVQSTQIFRMNEGAARRCIVLYSGIHYDTIVAIPSSSGYVRDPMDDVRQFEEDEEILFKARELALLFNSIDYFTDTGGMKLKCNMCDWIGYGEKAATIHCEQSGHADMEQVKDEK